MLLGGSTSNVFFVHWRPAGFFGAFHLDLYPPCLSPLLRSSVASSSMRAVDVEVCEPHTQSHAYKKRAHTHNVWRAHCHTPLRQPPSLALCCIVPVLWLWLWCTLTLLTLYLTHTPSSYSHTHSPPHPFLIALLHVVDHFRLTAVFWVFFLSLQCCVPHRPSGGATCSTTLWTLKA